MLVGPADGSADTVAIQQRFGRFLFSDVGFPGEVRAPLAAARPAVLDAPRREDAEWFLRYIFRKESFWEGQWETIERALRGLDSVVLLPTGVGKSIAFQLAALLRPGRCIVVDPIVDLIEDQGGCRAAIRQRDLEGEQEAGELAPGRDFHQRPGPRARVSLRPKFHAIEPMCAGRIGLGRDLGCKPGLLEPERL